MGSISIHNTTALLIVSIMYTSVVIVSIMYTSVVYRRLNCSANKSLTLWRAVLLFYLRPDAEFRIN